MSGEALTITGMAVALTLLLLVVLRAIVSTRPAGPRQRRLTAMVDIVIVPLVIIFLIIAAVRFAELAVPSPAPTPGPNPPRAGHAHQV